jgi:hypothetical protein
MDSKKLAEEVVARAKGGPVQPVFDPATEWQLRGIDRMFDAVFGPSSIEPWKKAERLANEGSRIADDCFCPSCNRRGFRFTCPACSR